MDLSIPANTTLSKLIATGSQESTQCCSLMICSNISTTTAQRTSVGGIFCSLNPFRISSLTRIHTKELFRRHQEKMLVALTNIQSKRLIMLRTGEVNPAVDRGVKIELITSTKRDEPVDKCIKNDLLMRRLILKGINVYVSHEKSLACTWR